MLNVHNISKRFSSNSQPILDNVSFCVQRGDCLGIVGNSGSGKSTLGRIILKLLEPDNGEIAFEDKSIQYLNKKDLLLYRTQVQMIFQDPDRSFNPEMTIKQSLLEPLIINFPNIKSQINSIINEMMNTVGIDIQSINKRPSEFSGGQLQRLSIARALLLKPKLLVADEPVSSLDVTIQSQILHLLVQLKNEFDLTIIFISHNLAVVEQICNKVLVLNQGKIVDSGELSSVFTDPKHSYTKLLIQSHNNYSF